MSTRDFSFGAAVLDEESLPERLHEALESWTQRFSTDAFVENASSHGVKAWTIRHEKAVQHQDALVSRLGNVVHELSAL